MGNIFLQRGYFYVQLNSTLLAIHSMYLFVEETDNMVDVVRKQKRETPFILKIGYPNNTIVVGSTVPFIESACSTEALLQLI